MTDFIVGLRLVLIMLRFIFGEEKKEDPKKKLLKARKDCPAVLYDVIYDELSPEKVYIKEYPTEGLYIAWAGGFIPVEEIGKSIFVTRKQAESKIAANRKKSEKEVSSVLARKCDRCGRFYEYYERGNGHSKPNAIRLVFCNLREEVVNLKKMDLCKDCMEGLESFLSVREGGHNDL